MDIFKAVENATDGSIAKELLIQIEQSYLSGEITQEEIDVVNNLPKLGFDTMAFKDDSGYWRVCNETRTHPKRYNTIEDLEQDYPGIN